MKDFKLTIKSGKVTDISAPDSVACGDKLRLFIPKEAVAISDKALAYLGSVDEIEVDSENPSFSSAHNCLLSKDGSRLFKASANADVSSLSNLRVIGSNAFSNLDRENGRIEIRLPDGVTTIEYRAFAMSANEAYITVPFSVVTVEALAFMIHADKVTVEFKGDPDVKPGAFGTKAERNFFTDTVLNILPEALCTDQSTYNVICPKDSKLAAYCGECGIGCRYMNSTSNRQISMIEYFSNDREAMPTWLEKFEVGQKVRISDLFTSRIVYNPGAGFEGGPIKTFCASHAAHIFVYVDYGFSKDEVDYELSDDAFCGYHLIHAQDLVKNELFTGTPTCHLSNEDKRIIKEGYERLNVNTNNSFGILRIYQRNDELGDEHGAFRFAVLYLGADAIATYDVLFGNTDCVPFASVIDTYGFGGAYEPFDKDSIMERIAQRTNRLPEYLICPSGIDAWEGYSKLRTVGGSRGRFLWVREA